MSKKKIKFPSNLVDSIEVNKIILTANPDNDNDAVTKKYLNEAIETASNKITGVGAISDEEINALFN